MQHAKDEKKDIKLANEFMKRIHYFCGVIKDYANIDNSKIKLLIESTLCNLATKESFKDMFSFEPLT